MTHRCSTGSHPSDDYVAGHGSNAAQSRALSRARPHNDERHRSTTTRRSRCKAICGDGKRSGRRLYRAGQPLPVPRPLRPSGQGQRQGQGRGAGQVRAAQLHDAGPGGGELRGAERDAGRALPRPAGETVPVGMPRPSASGWWPTWRCCAPCRRCRWSRARSGRRGSRRRRWSAIAATTTRCRPPTASGTCW